ncbi:hypothetical protein ACHAAC_16535 [Aeromicrobium sp. CF4.19]|uniref:hypothetical protein n=1 Tax=Aeromicrobium sp. CF4.19 TaxID=3373082 RepID=UPI003EE6EF47
MRGTLGRWLVGACALAMLCGGLVAAPAAAADDACRPGTPGCSLGGPEPAPGPDRGESDAMQSKSITTPKRVCSVYASGAGMGSYCVSGAGGDVETLRERFGSQTFQRCRYGEIPLGVKRPFNSRPDEGRYMMLRCLGNIDFDTYSGGRDRTLDISIVFVPTGTDTEDNNNGISRFLWEQVNNNTQLPVPIMQPRPNPTPLVGAPTYFTFQWIDPSSNATIAQGPFADRAQGGPFREIEENGFTMQAEATSLRIDPHQEGIEAVECDPSTPYREGAEPAEQPEDACSITFPRSSASARDLATEPIPDNIDEAFYASVEVTWQVSYGEDGSARSRLGDGFTMRLKQVVPVQEVQAPNQPPIVVF